MGESICDNALLCERLTPDEKCIRVRVYREGVFKELVHEHVDRSRLAEKVVAELLRCLVFRYEERVGQRIVEAHLIRRGRAARLADGYEIHCSYPEPGVLRRWWGANVAAWMDWVVDARRFRPGNPGKDAIKVKRLRRAERYIQDDEVRVAFRHMVELAESSSRLELGVERHGSGISSRLRYMSWSKPAYSFIVRRCWLTFYFRDPNAPRDRERLRLDFPDSFDDTSPGRGECTVKLRTARDVQRLVSRHVLDLSSSPP